MNKNVENYKKAVEQIHVDQDLKEKVLNETKEKSKSRKPIYYLSYAMSIAVIIIAIVVGAKIDFSSKGVNKSDLDINENTEIIEENKEEQLAKANIKRFSSIEELREFLKENSKSTYFDKFNSVINASEGVLYSIPEANVESSYDTNSSLDYSRTNNQVESVDEADIVKTDGKYIYYCQNSRVYILDNDLNLKAEINDDDSNPVQIFVNGKRLIVFEHNFSLRTTASVEIDDTSQDVIRTDDIRNDRVKTIVKVYDLDDIESPKLKRKISVDGSYVDARMIDDNIYFVTTDGVNLYKDISLLDDDEILPCYTDSFISDENITIDATKIAYFDNNNSNYNYSIVAGFNLNSDEDVNVETFLGFGSNLYVSTENLYMVSPNYDNWEVKDSTIYKFSLKDGDVFATGSVNVEGTVNNQFSIDEYEGNLRIATTIYNYDMENYESNYKTRLTIFDENLEKIGEIENLIEDEIIYSVRFIDKVGYIVTFEEVDPLWVIDLSNPREPIVRGELEIPGYSSYLHPWDENHIIGIGYNVKSNKNGGVTNDGMKLSMFDVSDLDNPKEIFNISLDSKLYSGVTNSHHLLFINKAKNLLGFPVSAYMKDKHLEGLILYRVDLENNKFEEINNMVSNSDFYGFSRFIYIGDYIYGLYYDKIKKYDINSFEEIKEVSISNEN